MEQKIKSEIEQTTNALNTNKTTLDKVISELNRLSKLKQELELTITAQNHVVETLNKLLVTDDNS